jgi:uncharacterized protein (TIGR03067 family)
MRKYAVVLAAALSLGFAPAPLPKPPSKVDLKKMQGTWACTYYAVGGCCRLVTWDERVVIARDRLTYSHEEAWSEWVVTLDVTKRPRAITLKGVGGDARGQVRRGTYRLEGDTLLMSFDYPAGSALRVDVDRLELGPGRCWVVWQRVKRSARPLMLPSVWARDNASRTGPGDGGVEHRTRGRASRGLVRVSHHTAHPGRGTVQAGTPRSRPSRRGRGRPRATPPARPCRVSGPAGR